MSRPQPSSAKALNLNTPFRLAKHAQIRFRSATIGALNRYPMLPPFCGSDAERKAMRRQHQERKLSMLTFWRDGLERQLAALNASISTLESQIQRDATDHTAG